MISELKWSILGIVAAAAMGVAAPGAQAAAFLISGPGAGNVDTNPATNVQLTSLIGGTITDLNVSVNITGDHMEDFDLFLTSPLGTVVQFRADFLGVQAPSAHIDPPLDATFDDEAFNPHDAQTLGGTGTFQAFSLLSAFDGQELLGNWTLSILDTLLPNEGDTLVSWSISGTTTATVPEPSTLALIGLAALGFGAARRRAN